MLSDKGRTKKFQATHNGRCTSLASYEKPTCDSLLLAVLRLEIRRGRRWTGVPPRAVSADSAIAVLEWRSASIATSARPEGPGVQTVRSFDDVDLLSLGGVHENDVLQDVVDRRFACRSCRPPGGCVVSTRSLARTCRPGTRRRQWMTYSLTTDY